jgi:hypothetical protein
MVSFTFGQLHIPATLSPGKRPQIPWTARFPKVDHLYTQTQRFFFVASYYSQGYYGGGIPAPSEDLKTEFLPKYSVRSSHETHYVYATNLNRLLLFTKTVAVYCENYMEHTDILCWYQCALINSTHGPSTFLASTAMLSSERSSLLYVYKASCNRYINTQKGFLKCPTVTQKRSFVSASRSQPSGTTATQS